MWEGRIHFSFPNFCFQLFFSGRSLTFAARKRNIGVISGPGAARPRAEFDGVTAVPPFLFLDGLHDLSGKGAEIVEVFGNNPIDDLPVHFLIGMHGRISEPHRFGHAFGGSAV